MHLMLSKNISCYKLNAPNNVNVLIVLYCIDQHIYEIIQVFRGKFLFLRYLNLAIYKNSVKLLKFANAKKSRSEVLTINIRIFIFMYIYVYLCLFNFTKYIRHDPLFFLQIFNNSKLVLIVSNSFCSS